MADITGNGQPESAPGLPPVVPPSGRFIAQLFLVPGLIVAGAVMVMLAFTWLAGGSGAGNKRHYLDNLRSTNTDIRWRTASDLAQVLRRDDALASDVDFGLSLTDLFRQAMDDLRRDEKSAAAEPASDSSGQTAQQLTKARKQYLGQRSYVQYLANSLGNLRTPIGAVALAEVARDPKVADKSTAALLQRQAVWSLAALGNNLEQLKQSAPEKREAVIEQLERASANSSDARKAAEFLRGEGRSAGIEALLETARADDPFLRKLSAHALTFWDGTPDENRRIEDSLVRLARDDGHGTNVAID